MAYEDLINATDIVLFINFNFFPNIELTFALRLI